ncbi:hypothetical protein K492DRAFT_162769 [Lichtheimia hyalospora FSU 10163]|nr:hypothetical protein K492DRAFT_162769 [Lichtheimia hyalospora FSU 10163]
MVPNSNKKLRILCLHGMGQNAVLFSKKSAALFRGTDNWIEKVYVNAPHAVLDPEYPSIGERHSRSDQGVSDEMRPYCWWFHDSYVPLTADGYFHGFKETLTYIASILSEKGPFDGIFGFSQGACLAAILAHVLENPSSSLSASLDHPPLKFVIFSGGFIPTQKATRKQLFTSLTTPLITPSLHLIGQVDTIIAPERMEALSRAFIKPFVYRHPGGHFVPTTSLARKDLERFMQNIQEQHSLPNKI